MSDPIAIHPPDSVHASLQPSNVPYKSLEGTWHVISSTLPLWKDKKNVTISYTPLPPSSSAAQKNDVAYNDIVEYHKKSAKNESKRSAVKGVSKTDVTPLKDGKPYGESGARFKWRGNGLLMIASSRWQILRYSFAKPGEETEGGSTVEVEGKKLEKKDEDWAVTYFAATLFTPAGLDIYARHPKGVTKEKLGQIIEAVKNVDDEVVKKLANDFFDIPHER